MIRVSEAPSGRTFLSLRLRTDWKKKNHSWVCASRAGMDAVPACSLAYSHFLGDPELSYTSLFQRETLTCQSLDTWLRLCPTRLNQSFVKHRGKEFRREADQLSTFWSTFILKTNTSRQWYFRFLYAWESSGGCYIDGKLCSPNIHVVKS